MLDYQPLVGAKIRLFTKEPGIDEDVKGSLTTVSLDDKPVYETLSYAWGDPKDARDICVDGSNVAASRNLYTAFRRFRRTNRPWTVWADAICINQHDPDERGRQVRLMGRIYSECEVCQIWLGETADASLRQEELSFKAYIEQLNKTEKTVDSLRQYIKTHNIRFMEPICKGNMREGLISAPGAFEILRLLAADKHYYELPFYRITTFPDFKLCRKWHHARRSLVNICSRAWWYRTWTIQEAVLPRHAMVNIGHHCISLEFFLRAAINFNKHASRSCCKYITGSVWELAALELSLGGTMFRLLDLQQAVAWRRGGPMPKSSRAASQLLHFGISKYRKATDPRDAVYGYLGILPDLLPPDHQLRYQESVQSLYGYTTKQYIYTQLNMGILKEIQPLSRARTDLASWTIDWLSNGQILRQNRYQASGDEFGSYTRSDLFDDPALLPVEILSIGRVTQVLTLPPDNVFSLQVGTLVQTLRAWRYAAGVPEKHDELTFWRTLYQDSSIDESGGQYPKFLPEIDLSNIDMWWPYFQGVSWTAYVLDYNDIISYQCRNSLLKHLHGDNFKPNIAFCVLDSGHIGILPLGVRVGDLVAVAKGLDYPIVLRMMSKDESPEREQEEDSAVLQEGLSATGKFLGCAYVDGVMYGEAVLTKIDWELIYLT